MRKVTQLSTVAGTFYCAAGRVPDHGENPGSGQLMREFETTDHVVCGKITGDATHEEIADPLIEHSLRGSAGIEAGQHHAEGYWP